MHSVTRTHVRLALATATAAALTGGLLTFSAATATAADSTTVPQADFNGDGIGDVAFSAHRRLRQRPAGAGQIVALYGTATGVVVRQALHAQPEHRRRARQPPRPATPSARSRRTRDFNGDGYDDLAVRLPVGEGRRRHRRRHLAILWGSASGLTGKGVDPPGPGRLLARLLGQGPGRAATSTATAAQTSPSALLEHDLRLQGRLHHLAGTAGAPYDDQAPDPVGHRRQPLRPAQPDRGRRERRRRTDLIVDGFETDTDYGWNTNYYVPGTASGLNGRPPRPSSPASSPASATSTATASATSSAAPAGTQHPGRRHPVPDSANGGKVNITYGSASRPGRHDRGHPEQRQRPRHLGEGRRFGWDLDIGDVNGDGYQDLVVSAPDEDIDGVTNTGMVTVLLRLRGRHQRLLRHPGLRAEHRGRPGQRREGRPVRRGRQARRRHRRRQRRPDRRLVRDVPPTARSPTCPPAAARSPRPAPVPSRRARRASRRRAPRSSAPSSPTDRRRGADRPRTAPPRGIPSNRPPVGDPPAVPLRGCHSSARKAGPVAPAPARSLFGTRYVR